MGQGGEKKISYLLIRRTWTSLPALIHLNCMALNGSYNSNLTLSFSAYANKVYSSKRGCNHYLMRQGKKKRVRRREAWKHLGRML